MTCGSCGSPEDVRPLPKSKLWRCAVCRERMGVVLPEVVPEPQKLIERAQGFVTVGQLAQRQARFQKFRRQVS